MKNLIALLLIVTMFVGFGCQGAKDLELCRADNEKLTAQIAEMQAEKEKKKNDVAELVTMLMDEAKKAQNDAKAAKTELEKAQK